MANWEAQEVRMVSPTTTNQSEDFEAGCNALYLVADATCFISFDGHPATSSSFLVVANQFYHMEKLRFKKVNYICSTGTPKLYLIASRATT